MTLTEILQKSPAFAPMTALERQTLEMSLSVDHFPRGHRFTEQGKRVNALYVVVDGEVDVGEQLAGTGHVHHKTLRPGDVFGFVSLLDGGTATATCRTRRAATVASLPREAVALLVSTQANIGQHFQNLLAHQLQRQFHVGAQQARAAVRAHDMTCVRARMSAH